MTDGYQVTILGTYNNYIIPPSVYHPLSNRWTRDPCIKGPPTMPVKNKILYIQLASRGVEALWAFSAGQWRRERAEGADCPGRQSERGEKMGIIRGQQPSHDFWGRQNCSPTRAPITHATPPEPPAIRLNPPKNHHHHHNYWPNSVNSKRL